MKIYFAHPISSYGTPAEASALKVIAERFPTDEIVNPNTTERQQRGRGNFSYFEQLVSSCNAIAYLPFPDGSIGFGIKGEVDALLKNNSAAKIYQVNINDKSCEEQISGLPEAAVLNQSETRAKNASRPFGASQVNIER